MNTYYLDTDNKFKVLDGDLPVNCRLATKKELEAIEDSLYAEVPLDHCKNLMKDIAKNNKEKETINTVVKELFNRYKDIDFPNSSYPLDFDKMEEMVNDVNDEINNLRLTKKIINQFYAGKNSLDNLIEHARFK